MSSPFEYAKSVTHTKESLYTNEELFTKEYLPFLVNRSLSNSPQTALFADAINQFHIIDKKMQYDFYLYGVPKQKGYSKWIKKDSELPIEQLNFICENLHVSMGRAIELYKIIDKDAIVKELDKRGGK